MKYYSQLDPRWANLNLGFSNSKIKDFGCFLCCLSMLSETPPDQANEKLKQAKAFYKDLIISEKAAPALNLEYTPPPQKNPPNHDCIVEVDYNPRTARKEQHFCVYLTSGKVVDPYDKTPQPKKNPYKIISFRYFKNKNTTMNKELINILEDITKLELGDDLNENEQQKVADKLTEYYTESKNEIEDLYNQLSAEKDYINELNETLKVFQEKQKETEAILELNDDMIDELEERLKELKERLVTPAEKLPIIELIKILIKRILGNSKN